MASPDKLDFRCYVLFAIVCSTCVLLTVYFGFIAIFTSTELLLDHDTAIFDSIINPSQNEHSIHSFGAKARINEYNHYQTPLDKTPSLNIDLFISVALILGFIILCIATICIGGMCWGFGYAARGQCKQNHSLQSLDQELPS